MAGFEELVAARGQALLRFATMLCGDEDRAEDLVQAALTTAYRRWSRVAAADRPEAYLKAIIVNEHLRWWRRLSNREVPAALGPPEIRRIRRLGHARQPGRRLGAPRSAPAASARRPGAALLRGPV